MSDSTIPPVTKSEGLHRNVKAAAFGGLAIMFLFTVGLIWLQRYLNSPAQAVDAKVADTQNVAPEREPALDDDPLQFLDPEPRDPDDVGKGFHSEPQPFMSSQEKAIRARQLLLIGQQADAIRNGVAELLRVQKALNESLEKLLSRPEGKRVAAQIELIDQFIAIRESIASTSTPAKNLSAEADVMLAPLENIESEPIQPEFENTLKELAEKIDSQLFAAQRGQRQLDVLLVASADFAAADLTLSSAIKRRSMELEKQQVADMASAAHGARQAVIETVADEAKAAQSEISKAERAVAIIKEKQRLDALKADKDSRISALAKAQLERDFQRDLPEISQLLRALITDGMTQPGRLGQFQQADAMGKVSLAKVHSIGAMQQTVQGRNALYYLIGSSKSRDRGAFPKHSGGFGRPSVVPTLLRAQELLVKYGQLMVEKKMLAE